MCSSYYDDNRWIRILYIIYVFVAEQKNKLISAKTTSISIMSTYCHHNMMKILCFIYTDIVWSLNPFGNLLEYSYEICYFAIIFFSVGKH